MDCNFEIGEAFDAHSQTYPSLIQCEGIPQKLAMTTVYPDQDACPFLAYVDRLPGCGIKYLCLQALGYNIPEVDLQTAQRKTSSGLEEME